jgi:hypothetical protein
VTVTRDPRDHKIEEMKADLDQVRDDIAAAKHQIESDGDIKLDQALPGD